ncbi:hypothetical protein GCM10029964_035620 [Kibdelosporangium lantanae]
MDELVWPTRGDRVPVTAKVEPHGLDLDRADPDTADHRIRAWWREAGHRGEVPGPLWTKDPDRQLTRLDPDSLARVLANLEERFLSTTRAGNQYSPDKQRDHLVTGLVQDLFGTVAACVAGGRDIPPMAAYAMGLPAPRSVPDDGCRGFLLLVDARRVGLIAIDTAIV